MATNPLAVYRQGTGFGAEARARHGYVAGLGLDTVGCAELSHALAAQAALEDGTVDDAIISDVAAWLASLTDADQGDATLTDAATDAAEVSDAPTATAELSDSDGDC